MTIFDILNSLIFTKKKINLNVEEEGEFNLYMVNRWVSMHSAGLATIINATTNTGIGQLLETKAAQYEFLYQLLPKCKFKRITYCKKKKEPKKEETDLISLYAKNRELSQREIKQYIDLQKPTNI